MDFERARFNMVEQQIRPWDVLDPQVLETLSMVRREEFVPPAARALAFADLEVPLDIDGVQSGEVMLTPKVEARLLQAAGIDPAEKILEIGTGSGFMAALLAHTGASVVSYEIRPELAAFARRNLARAGCARVSVREGNGYEQLCAGRETFDLILLSGSVAFVPEPLLERLAPGGRLIAIVGDSPMMTAQLIRRGPTGTAQSAEILFDTVAPSLQGFPAKPRFVF
jgi:protein-L-isoaspartate(D-aspartate) O-methyltransferase